MVSKAKFVLLGKAKVVLLGILAAGAIASLPASAAASEWFVGGAKLSGSAALSTKAEVTKSIVLSIPADKIKVECTELSFASLEILEKNKGQTEGIKLEGCKVIEGPAGCTIEERKITTEYVELVTVAGSGTSATNVKKARTSTFATFVLSERCGLPSGKVPIVGETATTAPTLQEERKEQALEFQGEKSEGLTVYKAPAYLTGKFVLKLKSEKTWSFH